MTTFKDLGLNADILRALNEAGYENPTPIQAEVVPPMSQGRNILGTAQTGTGKTASFVLPLLQQIANGAARPSAKACGTLILVPTRELAVQIVDNIKIYSRHMKASVAMVIGGVSANPQIQQMKKGVDILVATPGRLEDLQSSGDIRLDETRCVVLDEADQMLDFGFVPAIRRILKKLPQRRQTVLLSATMPEEIRKLANQFVKNPVEIAVAPVSKPIERIDQKVIHLPKADKKRALLSLLGDDDLERAIVFSRTKHGASKLSQFLEKAGLKSAAIHGNKSQNARQNTINGFRDGKLNILVATDIAARGIDIDDVSHVVNFDLPDVPEVYVHRIGRTARAGKSGIAFTLCDPTEKDLLKRIERLTGIGLTVSQIDLADLPARSAPAANETGAESKPQEDGQQPKRRRSRGRKRNSRGGQNGQGQSAQGQKTQGQGARNQAARPDSGGNKPQKPAGSKPRRNRNQKHQGEQRPGSEGDSAGLSRMLNNANKKRRPRQQSTGA
ncbi:DEAD/DEAH box helicase [Aestuariispira insulae]|uniref:ATP-dependent RNA helicase RhlE n=1 Tax=Aestuariispira insulae TaxID=1461337 RepID=A0A3D9HRX4_9PROT|nr:DEAD/DEAH box helicase [Aestuariispira insulae]RED52155.1 ATP-dependent RNA helicase RhlE [Aestuariispira insulae]